MSNSIILLLSIITLPIFTEYLIRINDYDTFMRPSTLINLTADIIKKICYNIGYTLRKIINDLYELMIKFYKNLQDIILNLREYLLRIYNKLCYLVNNFMHIIRNIKLYLEKMYYYTPLPDIVYLFGCIINMVLSAKEFLVGWCFTNIKL